MKVVAFHSLQNGQSFIIAPHAKDHSPSRNVGKFCLLSSEFMERERERWITSCILKPIMVLFVIIVMIQCKEGLSLTLTLSFLSYKVFKDKHFLIKQYDPCKKALCIKNSDEGEVKIKKFFPYPEEWMLFFLELLIGFSFPVIEFLMVKSRQRPDPSKEISKKR